MPVITRTFSKSSLACGRSKTSLPRKRALEIDNVQADQALQVQQPRT